MIHSDIIPDYIWEEIPDDGNSDNASNWWCDVSDINNNDIVIATVMVLTMMITLMILKIVM